MEKKMENEMEAGSIIGDYRDSGFLKLEVPFLGGPYNKDYSILGSILGSPYLGKLPYKRYRGWSRAYVRMRRDTQGCGGGAMEKRMGTTTLFGGFGFPFMLPSQ